MVTWSQSEDSSDDENENEVANLCFMAFEDKNEVNSNLDENEDFIFDYDDFLKAIYKVDEKNTSLKKKLFELQKELDETKGNFSKIEASKLSLEKENEELLKKNEWLVSSLSKFSCGQKAFDMILASQKCVFDKRGLGYKCSKNEKHFKNYFFKESISESPSTICNFCGIGGHISSTCPLINGSKKTSTSKLKRIWIEKTKVTNHQGPKKIWVPKAP